MQMELEQVDFFIEQNLVDEATGMLVEMEMRFPGHPALAERREKVAAISFAANTSQGAVPALAHDDAAPSGIQPAPSGPFPATRSMGEDSHDLDTRADLGIMEKTMERYESAITHFSALMADPRREVFALTMIGECREAMGNSAEAIRCYQEALKRPTATEAEATQLYYQLGSVFHNLGDRSEALYYFERVSKREPAFRDVQRRLSDLKPRASVR
jgi:tetratricopeptide (TPR) repeat protein